MGQRSNCSKSGRLDMDPLSEDSEPPSSSDSDDTVEDETYEIDPTDLQSDEEEIDFSDEEDAGSESGDSECGDHLIEELQYDTEELIVTREMNRNLRRVQQTSVGPVATNQVFKQGMVLPPNIERRGLGRRYTDIRRNVNDYSIKTSSSKIKHDNPPRKESRSADSEFSTKKRAKEVLAKLSAQNPSFLKRIVHSHTRRRDYLSIPAKFCKKHLPQFKTDLELVDKGGNIFRVHYLGYRHVLTTGWSDFLSAHKLDEGDFLVGQLVNKDSFQVEIHIIRQNVLAETDADVTISSNSYFSTKMRAQEVLAKLSAQNPSFLRRIVHSYTGRYLSIPAKFCKKHLPQFNANLELVGEGGKTFGVHYLGDRYMLTTGWNDFLSAHKLVEGDFLVGQLVNKASFQVEIHIIRHNVLAETDGDLGLLESDTYVTISNGEKNCKVFAKGQEKHLERLSSCSPSNILEDPDYMPPGLCTDEVLKCSSAKMHLRSSKYAQQSRESNHPDPSSLQSTSMISDPVLQATDTGSAPVPVSLQATIDKTPKHRSCKVQLRTCQEATRNQPEQIENEYGIADFHFSRSRKRRRAYPAPRQSTNTSSDPGLLRGIAMSTVQFADHLERIWRSFPTDKLVDFTYLECFWFTMYREAPQRTLVLSWIKKKDIFSRKYIFVSICIWGHWNLLILCHFGESLPSESKKPFMLLLDSLHKAEPMRYEPEIRKFVMGIFKEEGVSDRSVSKIRLLVPKVPQQKNKECGYFTLYYIKKFIEATLETISDDDLIFLNENWFSQEELDGFCVALHEESKAQELLDSQDMALNESSTDGDVICLD